MNGEPLLQPDDLGVDVGGQPGRDGPAATEVPGPVTVEERELLPGADVDPVQRIGVLVPELAGDQRPDIAAGGGVPVVPEDAGHEGVPEVGDLPEVHVRIVRQGSGEPEAGHRGDDHVERLGRVAAVRARVGQRVDDLGPVPERPRPPVGQNQRGRLRADPSLAHEVDRHALDLHPVVLVDVDRGLGLAPAVVGAPVVDELLQIGPVHAVVPAGTAGSRCRATMADVSLICPAVAICLAWRLTRPGWPGQL
jgi:hypothetical protein